MSSHASIPNDNDSGPELGLEDFRRLGVRPLEYRQTVIRLAALRSSRTLAKQQLTVPSEQGSLQLSRLMTSAYRLLDPRQREDPMHRALVGRILPHVLSGAGQTHFVSDFPAVAQSVSDVGTFDDEDGTLIEIRAQSELSPQWTITLGDQDLIGSQSKILRIGQISFRRAFRSASYAVIALVIVGFMVGAFVGFSGVGDYLELARMQPPPVAVATGETAGAASEIAPTISDEQPRPTSLSVQPAVSLEQPTESAQSVSLSSDPIPTPSQSQSVAVASSPESPTLPAQVDEAKQSQPVPSQSSKSLPPQAEPPPEGDLRLRPSLRNPVPAGEDVRAVRRKLAAEFPRLSESIAIQSIGQRIDLLMAYADQQSPGSAEYWTAGIMLAEHHWLVDDIGRVRQQLEGLTDHYQTSTPMVLASTFIRSCSLARLPETHEHLFTNGLRLCDWLLVTESTDECEQIVEILSQIDQQPEPTDANRRLKDYSDAIDQMVRLAGASELWIQQVDKSANAKNTGSAGRYHCLFLRKWDLGLPWLTAVSDKRIARVAQQELEAQDVESQFDVANRWLEIAKRYAGRAANSMRLHGIGQLRAVKNDSTAIKQLQIERAIDEAMQALPIDLRPIAFSREPSPPAKAENG
jgi:hypothetical protein